MTGLNKPLGVSYEQAAAGLKKLGEAGKKVEFPTMREIARLRLDMLKAQHGVYRFLMTDYWKWNSLFITSGDCNAKSSVA